MATPHNKGPEIPREELAEVHASQKGPTPVDAIADQTRVAAHDVAMREVYGMQEGTMAEIPDQSSVPIVVPTPSTPIPADPAETRTKALELLRKGGNREDRMKAAGLVDQLGVQTNDPALRQIASAILQGAPAEDMANVLQAQTMRDQPTLSDIVGERAADEDLPVDVSSMESAGSPPKRYFSRSRQLLSTAAAGIPFHLIPDMYKDVREWMQMKVFPAYRKHRDDSRLTRNVDATGRTVVGGLLSYAPTAWAGNLPLIQGALGSWTPLGVLPMGLAAVPAASIVGYGAWKARRARQSVDVAHRSNIIDWARNFHVNVTQFNTHFAAELPLPTNELIDTYDEEEMIAGLHTRMWTRRGEIPIMHSVEHYARYTLPILIELCQQVKANHPSVRSLSLPQTQKDQLIAHAPDPTGTPAHEESKWTRLRQVAIAYGKFLAKWHQKRTEGQVTGALAGTGLGLGLTTGPVAPVICGLTWAGRKWWLKHKHADTDIELRHDGKLECNLDPEHFDAGGRSLYSQGRFIEDVPMQKDEWLKSRTVKYWYDRIQIPEEARKRSGSKKSPKHLGINATRSVQLALTKVDPPPTIPTDREKERLKETYENLRDERKKLLGEQTKLDEEIAKLTAAEKRIKAQLMRLKGATSDYERTRRDELELSLGEAQDDLIQAKTKKSNNEIALVTGDYAPTKVDQARKAMDNAEKGTAVPRLTYQAVGENDDICKAFAIRVVEAYGPLTENAIAKKMKKYTGEKLASAVGVLLDNTQEVVVTGAAIGTVGAIGMGGAVLAGQSLPVLGTLLGGLSVAKWAVGGGVAGFIFGSGYTLITKVASAPFVAAKKIAAAAVGGEKKEEKKP